MNNWNNAERKRGAVPWRSRNIDRKITIGLKTAVACLGSREAKDRTWSIDDVDASTPEKLSILAPRAFLSPFLDYFQIRCTLVDKSDKNTICLVPRNVLFSYQDFVYRLLYIGSQNMDSRNGHRTVIWSHLFPKENCRLSHSESKLSNLQLRNYALRDNLNSNNKNDLGCFSFSLRADQVVIFKRFTLLQRLVVGLSNDGMSRVNLLVRSRWSKKANEEWWREWERDKSTHGAREETRENTRGEGWPGERDAATRGREESGRRRRVEKGMVRYGGGRDGWRSEVAEAEMKYWSVEARATPADPPLSTIFRRSLIVVNAAEIFADFTLRSFAARYPRTNPPASLCASLSSILKLKAVRERERERDQKDSAHEENLGRKKQGLHEETFQRDICIWDSRLVLQSYLIRNYNMHTISNRWSIYRFKHDINYFVTMRYLNSFRLYLSPLSLSPLSKKLIKYTVWKNSPRNNGSICAKSHDVKK